jgi:hypothetical protein
MDAAVSEAFAPSRSAIMTDAPSRTQARAHSRPIPLAAPVIKITLFFNNKSTLLE